jgi:integrase
VGGSPSVELEAVVKVKRAYGSGSIEERGGRFRARLRMADRSVTDLGTYATRDEAAGVLAASVEEVAQGLRRTDSTTLAELGTRWLAERASAHRNAAKDASVWRRHVASAPIATLPVGSIESRDVVAWLKGLGQATAVSAITTAGGKAVLRKTERMLSRSVVKQAFKLLRMCVDSATEEGLCPSNPARAPEVGKHVRLLRSATTEDAWTYLTAAEIAAIENAEGIDEGKRLTILFAIYTGLRQGELWGLRWADVDLDSETPHMIIRYSFAASPTKSGKVATVPLLPAAVAVLRRWRAVAPHPRPLPKGERGPEGAVTPPGLVFPNPDGACYAKGYDGGWADRASGQGKHRKVTAGIKTRSGITRRARFHDLRHTAGSHLIMGTWGRPWRLEEIRDFLRHSDIAETQR